MPLTQYVNMVYSYFSYTLIINAIPITDKMQKNFHAFNLLPIISRLVYNFAYIVPSLELYCISFHLTGALLYSLSDLFFISIVYTPNSKAIFPKIWIS
ncbi:hypothetical protein QOT17_023597 [Balamuthia mandrillaris]